MKRTTRAPFIVLMAVAGGFLAQQYFWTPSTYSAPTRSSAASVPPEISPEQARAAYGRLPLSFEENRGQTAAEVKFLARGQGYNLYLTSTEAVLAFPPRQEGKTRRADNRVLRMRLAGASATPTITGMDQMPGRANYLGSSDPAKWQTNVPTYEKVKYANVYPGIDQVYYGNQQKLEYDLIVAPGANPAAIRLAIEGAEKIRLDKNGDLSMLLQGQEVRLSRPVAYQEVDGEKQPVACRYVLSEKREVRLEMGAYDKERPMVIDPVLQYSTYLGGGVVDIIYDLAIDDSGNAYVTGWSTSDDFPATPGAYQTNRVTGSRPVFVAKLNPSGTALVYATYLGTAGNAIGTSIAVDHSGNAFITGWINSIGNYPVTPGAFQTTVPGGPFFDSGFVTKLNSTGSGLIYSTYLGGTQSTAGLGIAVDASGSAYVTGETGAGFPTTPSAFQTNYKGPLPDGFVTRLNPSGSALIYSTYLGGNDYDRGQAIAVDDADQAYVVGVTGIIVYPSFNSGRTEQRTLAPVGDYPVTPGAYQTNLRGDSDLFVTKLNASGSALVYSTFLGGTRTEGSSGPYYSSESIGRAIVIDAARNAYVTGATYSLDFPTTPGAFQPALFHVPDAFVTKLNATGSGLIYSTFLGGLHEDSARAIALDSLGNAYVTGRTSSPNFPVTPDALQKALGGSGDAFLAKVNGTGTVLSYSSFIGGSSNVDYATCIAVNSAGSAFVGGGTFSTDFPTTSSAFQRNLRGIVDSFIAKVVPGVGGLVLSRVLPDRGGDTGTVSALVQGLGFQDGATVRLTRPGEADIVGTLSDVRSDGRTIRTAFNLRGKARGLWNVVVANPDGTTATIQNGFTIEAGQEPTIKLETPVGAALSRPGQKQYYWITYRNQGNIDISGVPIWIKAKGSAGLRLISAITLPAPLPGEPPIDLSSVNTVHGTPDGALTMIVMPAILPPGRSGYIAVEVTTPSQAGNRITLEAWANPPVFKQLEDPFPSCYLSIIKLVGDAAGASIPASCDDEIRQAWLTIVDNAVQQSYFTPNAEPVLLSLPQVLTAISSAAIRCAGGTVQTTALIDDVSDVLWDRNELNKCFGTMISYVLKTITVVNSYDPNDKFGIEGAGAGRYILGDEQLGYAIFFENQPTATAPAREVVIRDQLDVSTMDLNTFSFGPINFGAHIEIPTPGLTDFAADVDLRPGKNLIVRIVANLDPATGLLVWRFTSIDPVTGQPPTDPSAGFLPPNINSPEGAGSVLFTIQPKAGLTTGTRINNQASIVFDQNNAIQTPVWLNTVDLAKPSSQVTALAAAQQSTNFEVRWTGTDADSGIGGYTIYVAVDSGPYLPWLTNTTATSASYPGISGRRYSFYSVAQDLVGNAEDAPPAPDAVTTVVQNYDFCLQDDRTGDSLLINSFTGEYLFRHCGSDGFTLAGTGRITRVYCTVSLSSALVNATLESCAINPLFSGTARVKRTILGPTFQLNDRDLSNNICDCK